MSVVVPDKVVYPDVSAVQRPGRSVPNVLPRSAHHPVTQPCHPLSGPGADDVRMRAPGHLLWRSCSA